MSRSISLAAGAGDVQATTGNVTLVGFSVRESTASAATLVLRDGTTTGDPIKVTIGLAAGAGQVTALPAVDFSTGIFVDRTTGTTELVLYIL